MSTCILLATYNGAQYLPQLLTSLQRQTSPSWQLLVRDDSSTDGTPEILAEAAAKDRRILLLGDSLGRQGAAKNFGLLMQAALDRDAEHVAFADQDDVWTPEKLARHAALMNEAERVHGRDMPILIHSDLTVVDETLATRHASFMHSSGLLGGIEATAGSMLVRNHVVGCTMLANRRLLELALPAPREMVMHDWWLGLLAITGGRLVYDDASTVLYRQHAGNEVGATTLVQKLTVGLPDWRAKWKRALGNFAGGVAQAHALRGRLEERFGENAPAALPLVAAYCNLFDGGSSRPGRLYLMHRLGIRPAGLLPQAAVFARALALPATIVRPAA